LLRNGIEKPLVATALSTQSRQDSNRTNDLALFAPVQERKTAPVTVTQLGPQANSPEVVQTAAPRVHFRQTNGQNGHDRGAIVMIKGGRVTGGHWRRRFGIWPSPGHSRCTKLAPCAVNPMMVQIYRGRFDVCVVSTVVVRTAFERGS